MGSSRFWLKAADEESKSILHEFPRSHWLKATGQCVLERYLLATMFETLSLEQQGFILYAQMSHVMRKLAFCKCENKGAVTVLLISAFIYTTKIVQSLFFLNPKFQASSHLLWLYSPVCVSDQVGNPKDRFYHDGAHMYSIFSACQCQLCRLLHHPGFLLR